MVTTPSTVSPRRYLLLASVSTAAIEPSLEMSYETVEVQRWRQESRRVVSAAEA